MLGYSFSIVKGQNCSSNFVILRKRESEKRKKNLRLYLSYSFFLFSFIFEVFGLHRWCIYTHTHTYTIYNEWWWWCNIWGHETCGWCSVNYKDLAALYIRYCIRILELTKYILFRHLCTPFEPQNPCCSRWHEQSPKWNPYLVSMNHEFSSFISVIVKCWLRRTSSF